MRRYKEVAAEFTIPEPIKKEYKFFAYTGGQSYGPFDNREDAINISKNYEMVCVNAEEYKQSCKAHNDANQKVYDKWFAELRTEYNDLNDNTFFAIYNIAYDRGHSSGYDAVADYMIDYYELAIKIIDANK